LEFKQDIWIMSRVVESFSSIEQTSACVWLNIET
jgi:hypothetical protein